MEQATAEYCAAVTNLTTYNSKISKQVALYANCLYTKDTDNTALQTEIKNLRGEVKNIKAEVATLKISSHSSGAGATKKKRGITQPKFKIEGQAHHPTWWSTPYCWIHVVGVHGGTY